MSLAKSLRPQVLAIVVLAAAIQWFGFILLDKGLRYVRPPVPICCNDGPQKIPYFPTSPYPPLPEPPAPPPTPILPVRQVTAVPLTDPEHWISANDYPSRALRNGVEGRVAAMLTVGQDGRATTCTIVRSSGYTYLDGATCGTLMRRARFAPLGRDSDRPVEGKYEFAFDWQIPDQ